MTTTAARSPIISLNPGAADTTCSTWCAPDRYLQARMGEAARGVDHPQNGARRQVRGRGVELDHHEADPVIGRQLPAGTRAERTSHAGDVGQGLQ